MKPPIYSQWEFKKKQTKRKHRWILHFIQILSMSVSLTANFLQKNIKCNFKKNKHTKVEQDKIHFKIFT